MCLKPILTYKIGNSIRKLDNKLKLNPKILNYVNSNSIVQLKCGKCKECLIEKTIEIKNRLLEELKINPDAYFLTLTYDEKHKKDLNKRDIQLFIKRYRKIQKLRYFYVGELGEKTKRPHYHAIIFTKLPKDLKESNTTTKNGYKQYESEEISKLWGNGLIKICKMEKGLIGYIVKYMLKNTNSKEFICGWSRVPPIGINPETIKKDIEKRKRTRALKDYYRRRYGEIPENPITKEEKELKIQEIEKSMKMPYIEYIKKKAQYDF